MGNKRVKRECYIATFLILARKILEKSLPDISDEKTFIRLSHFILLQELKHIMEATNKGGI